MGILDELKQEADLKRACEEQQKRDQEQLEKRYRQEILPKMQKIYTFFKEMVEYLQYLQKPIEIDSYSKRYPQFDPLVQKEYKLTTDQFGGVSHFDELKEIYLKFYCIGEGSFELQVKNQAEVEQLIAFLGSKKVPFEWSRQFNRVEKSSATFVIERKIPVKIQFVVDIEQGFIRLDIYNYHNFNHIFRVYRPQDIDDAFLDELARFILRKENRFSHEKLTEAQRRAIRERLLQSRQHPDETAEAETEKNSSNLLNKVFSLIR